MLGTDASAYGKPDAEHEENHVQRMSQCGSLGLQASERLLHAHKAKSESHDGGENSSQSDVFSIDDKHNLCGQTNQKEEKIAHAGQCLTRFAGNKQVIHVRHTGTAAKEATPYILSPTVEENR